MQNLRQKAYNLLRWSEQYTKTDMVYLARGGFWLTLGQAVSAATAFGLAVAFANLLPKYEFGIYKYIISISGILTAFSLTGLTVALTQSASKGFAYSLVEGFWINLRWSGLVVMFSALGAIYYFLNDNNVLAISLVFVMLTTPLINSYSLYHSFLAGKGDFKSLSIYGSWKNLVITMVLIGALFVSDNPLIVIGAYLLSHVLSNSIFFFFTFKKYPPDQNKDSEMASYAKHLSVMNILNIVSEHIDKILVFQYVGAIELAIYTFATAIPIQVKGILKNIYQLAFPKFSLRRMGELKKNLPEKMLIFSILALFIFVLYYFSAPTIFKYLFPQYLEAIKYSQLFMLSILFYPSVLIGTAMQSQKMIPEMYRVNIISSPIKIILVIILTYIAGILGLIIARILSEFVNLVILSVFFFRKNRIKTIT